MIVYLRGGWDEGTLHIDRSVVLLIKMFYLTSNSNSNVIFVFTGVDLYNRILILSQNSDLEFSTSST